MPPLPTQLRNRLETAVKQARRTAEAAAKVVVERLTVGSAEPGSHLTVDERLLRNRLRAHGRQLGDGRDSTTGVQSINRLIHECAYENWHRMLFARFLAENHLLIHEKVGMPVTLAECDELAVDEGAPDGWTLAARYAARMLPQIFRPDDPVLQVGFAPEHKRALEKLVTELPVEVFTAEDSLGWVYQFWQAEHKEKVNKSGDKITGETLPAVTQLFTEHYMVLFLLHNTIGAWYAGRTLTAEIAENAETEQECRKAVSLPGYEFTYLRFVRDETTTETAENTEKKKNESSPSAISAFSAVKKLGRWRAAAGAFPGWPKSLKDFKLLDPCCGSGHFLVAAFVLLVRLRMQVENLSAKDACDAVLRENLHGLELDLRCTQIAAFALALTAWKFPNLPAPVGDDVRSLNPSSAANGNQSLLTSSPTNPIGYRALPPLNIACSGLGVNARKEDWLALANGDTRLGSGLEQLYDLFQKAPELGSLINPRRLAHGDLVTASFAEIQPLLTKALQSEKARKNDDFNEIGVAAQGMANAAAVLNGQFHLVVTNVPYLGSGKQSDVLKTYCEKVHQKAKSDLATCFVTRCLEFCAAGGSIALVTPQSWLFLKTYRLLRESLLREVEWNLPVRLGPNAFIGMNWWAATTALLCLTNRLPQSNHAFAAIDVSAVKEPTDKGAALQGEPPIMVVQARQLDFPTCPIVFENVTTGSLLSGRMSAHYGSKPGQTSRVTRFCWELPQIIPGHWTLLESTPYRNGGYTGKAEICLTLEQVNLQKITEFGVRGAEAWNKRGFIVSRMNTLPVSIYCGNIFDDNAYVLVPRDAAHLLPVYAFLQSDAYRIEIRKRNQKVAVDTQAMVQVPFDLAHWQRVAAEKFPNGLPEPASNDPTQWLFAGHPVDSTAPLQVGVARLLGYRWPRQTGQTVSGAPPVPEDGLENLVDEDGIVCIPSVRGEAPAAERLRVLLAAAYGKAWSPARLDELLSAVDYAGSNLEDWLRNGFFEQHSKLFHHRPFIWHIWDGRKDGFSALVNYHKLDHKLLEKLTYTALGEWIKKQQEAVANGEGGADDRLVKAQQLQDKLKLILEGEGYPDPDPEKSWGYDIFVRWKPLEQQPIGWQPDLNDGVRLNIRPFMEADVLRKRPNIKWGIDRGKNPPGSPWGEERNNDRHLTLAEKRRNRSAV